MCDLRGKILLKNWLFFISSSLQKCFIAYNRRHIFNSSPEPNNHIFSKICSVNYSVSITLFLYANFCQKIIILFSQKDWNWFLELYWRRLSENNLGIFFMNNSVIVKISKSLIISILLIFFVLTSVLFLKTLYGQICLKSNSVISLNCVISTKSRIRSFCEDVELFYFKFCNASGDIFINSYILVFLYIFLIA